MSCQRMPVVEQVLDDPSGYARIELALATTMPSAQAARVFLWLATYPWRAVTWFGPGHSVRWYHEPATFPLGAGGEAVLLLDSPGMLPGPQPPDLSGFTFGGDPVRWLWIVPISERDRKLAKEHGSARWSAVSPRRAEAGSRGRRSVRPSPAGGGPRPMAVAAAGRSLMHGKVDAEQDQPPKENGKHNARRRLQPGEENIAAVPRDHDPDENVADPKETSEPDRHVFLGSSPNRSKTGTGNSRERDR